MTEELPLTGVKVLELAQMVAGPSAGLLLADYGAEVIKVEPPQGDGGRQLRSLAAAGLPDSPVFVGYNRDKRLIRLDLRTPAGRARVLELIDEADVLIEAGRPGAMERLELGAGELLARNPRLVYASVSGFGRGPIGSRKGGVDIVVQAESGIISTTGYPDRPGTKIGFTAVDAASGHALCHGILAALFRRERTGRGDVVRLSLYDVALHLQTGPLTEYLMTGVQTPRAGNSAPLTAPADLLRCSDGEIIVSAYLDPHWRAFTVAIGAPGLADDPRFGDGVLRARHRAELVELIEKRLADGTVASWTARLQQAGVLVAEVKDYAGVVADPLAAESGMLRGVGPDHGVASPVRLERTKQRILRPRQELDPADVRFGRCPVSLVIDLAAGLETLPDRSAPLERTAEVSVSEHAIRTWCAAIGERNPLYLDREAARRAGYPAVVAPPAMLQTWTMPIAERSAAPTLHARVRAAARDCGLEAVVATDYEQEYLRPVHPGQMLREYSWIEAVSRPKATSLGRGQFVTIAFEISDRAGPPVGRMRARTLYFRPAPAAPRTVATEDEPGDMAPLQIPLTRTLIVAASLASNDHEAVHHDHEIARAQGLDDIIASIVTTAGLVLRYTGLTAGDAPCRSLALQLARPAFPGDVLAFQGRATVSADGTRLHVRGDHARGRHVTAEVSYGHRS